MRFLFISSEGLAIDLAWQVRREGNEVRFYNRDPEEQELGKGFFDIVPSWEPHADWADVIVFDDVLGMGALADGLRKQGKRVVGGTPYSDRLEDDREFGQEELARAGVTTIPRWPFSRFEDAAAFVRAHPGKYVIKPSGEAQNLKSLLYVGEDKDGGDVIRMLEGYGKAFGPQEFQLQAHVEGVEVAVGAFYNGSRFVTPINVNFEHKRLFPGDIGPMTGEMGTMMCWRAPNALYERTLARMEARLAGYVGYVDLNCIANAEGIWPLEWTTRFGYPTISIQQDGIGMPMGAFLAGLADGTLSSFPAASGYQVGVRIVIPPWPFADQGTFAITQKHPELDHPEVRVLGPLDGIHIESVMVDDGTWRVAGSYTCVLVVTGMGATVARAQRQAYARIKRVRIPMMYYRNDIGSRWKRDGKLLERWGYL